MSVPPVWIVPAGQDVDSVADRLGKLLKGSVGSTVVVHRTFHDTFDWRLWARQEVLVCSAEGGSCKVRLEERDGTSHWGVVTLAAPPRWPADVPVGRLRDHLAERAGLRAFVPQVEVQGEARVVTVSDGRGKTTVRLSVEHGDVVGPRGKRRSAGVFVWLQPVLGYDDAAKDAQAALRRLQCRPRQGGLLEHAFAVLDSRPGDDANRLDVLLDADERADVAIKRILARALGVMRANERGMSEQIDTEFLHDFRVAVRRTRSVLAHAKGVFAEGILERFTARFRWLGTVTSAPRDMDVWLLSYPELEVGLPADVQAHLQPLHALLRRKALEAHAQLARDLDSGGYARWVEDWERFLGADVPLRTSLPHATEPVRDLARRRVAKAWRRVLDEGRAIDDGSPAEALHALRKSCKKLRYLLEVFHAVLGDGEAGRCIRDLKGLQTVLGEFQDREVQAAALSGFGQELMGDPATPADTLLAMGALVDDLRRRQHAARAAFHEAFEAFDRPKVAARFETLLGAA